MEKYMNYLLEQLQKLISIDSPTGFTRAMSDYVMEEYTRLGYQPQLTVKGGVVVDLGGEGNGIMVLAHGDTLGAMVAEVKGNGRLRIVPVGGLNANNVETETCRVYGRGGRVVEGTIQLMNASTHVNGSYSSTARSFDTVEVVLDMEEESRAATLAQGIGTGCFVCVEPRLKITESGYIKGRFLDDKLSAAILLAYARYVKEEKVALPRKVYHNITVFEEVGHGACASIPADVVELLSVDMGCVGDGLACTEKQVSICVKDGRGPYHYDVVQGLIAAAEGNGIDYAADVYPFYGSDADAALTAGVDAKHGLIGAGVYASHGYERSHKDGALNTLRLLKAYIG